MRKFWVGRLPLLLVPVVLMLSAVVLVAASGYLSAYVYDDNKDNYLILNLTDCEELAGRVEMPYEDIGDGFCRVWGLDYALALIYDNHYNVSDDGCEDECSSGDKRCLDANTLQLCDDYDNDTCSEWGGDTVCEHGCAGGVCLEPGITTWIRPARMVLYENITQGHTKYVTASLFVKNVNTGEIRVELSPTGDLDGITDLSEDVVILAPGEEREINFTMAVNTLKTFYSGGILANFIAGGISLGSTAEVYIYVTITEEPCKESGEACTSGDECCSGVCLSGASDVIYGPEVTSSASFLCPMEYSYCELYQTKTVGDLRPMEPLLLKTCNPGTTCSYWGAYAEYTGYGKSSGNVCQ